MDANKVKELLTKIFSTTPIYPKKRHIFFWYDDGGSFKELLKEIDLEDIKVFYLEKGKNRRDEEIDLNIFELKYKIEVEDRESNYLIYSEHGRPEKDQENFLLDIEKYSEYFDADKAAMLLEELELDRRDPKILELLKKYEGFFGNKERKEKLLKVIGTNERTKENLELGILATLTGSKVINFTQILTDLIVDQEKLQIIEKWMGLEFLYKNLEDKYSLEIKKFDKFIKNLVVTHLYRSIKQKPHKNLENHFKGDTTELFLFADNLLQNQLTSKRVQNIFYEVGKELGVGGYINSLELDSKVQGSTFEYFDKIIVKELGEKLALKLEDYDLYRKYIDIRLDTSLWKEKYSIIYNGLKGAINFFDITKNLEIIQRDTLEEINRDYVEKYYKIDRYYREFYFAYDNSKGDELSKVLENLERNISTIYEDKYLDKLHDIWGNKIKDRKKLNQQYDFYKNHVEKCDTRVAVIISDALRYEVATEIREKLIKETRNQQIEMTSMVTDLPSITSIGMANLLPNKNNISYDINTKKVTIDGMATSSTKDREKILKLRLEESSAIVFADFNRKHRSEQEEYIKGKKVIYIYHDQIDAIGDKSKTESKTFDACNDAIDDIVSLTKTLTSLGVVNTFITSDHGFLYEKDEIQEHEKLEINSEKYLDIGKRFLLSDKLEDERGLIVMEAQGKFGAFPHKNQRIKSSGGGLQFVHGGISPQEMIIPLIKFRSGVNATKARKVDVRLKESLGKITSNLSKFGVYQLDPVNINNKIMERDIKVALYSEDGVRISNEEKIRLNSTETNHLHNFNLTLSGDIKKVTLKVTDLKTDDILDSKEYEVNLSIAAEFDF